MLSIQLSPFCVSILRRIVSCNIDIYVMYLSLLTSFQEYLCSQKLRGQTITLVELFINVSLKAIQGGVFLRSPVSWIGQWQTLMDKAWVKIVEDHVSSWTSIPSILQSENSAMNSFLQTNYNQQVANEYENGTYAPIEGA